MNRLIRRIAFALLLLFGGAYLNLVWIQVIRAESLASHDRNLRLLLREYSIERGRILSADGQTLAESRATPDEELKQLRVYPLGPRLAHVTGHYSIVFGRDGLERSHNRELVGRGGQITMQDLSDRLLGKGRRGDTLVLSIDTRVQAAAEAALGQRKGAVVALDPLTGQILAMVSFPSYDPGALSGHDPAAIRDAWARLNEDPNKPMLNRAAEESYPPGSTFKIVTAAAALQHGRGVETAFPPTSEYQPAQTERVIHNFGGSRCGGTMADAFRVSCNTYFARLGAELSEEEFAETASAFGFGEVPPLDLTAAASRVPSVADLRSPAFRAQAAIGQFDVSATPLQMALAGAAVANRGRIPIPKMVREIRDARNVIIDQARPVEWRTAISEETAITLGSLMVSVVESGTGRGAQLSGVRIAGKTGTAQTGREGEAPHAWFVAYAPADTPRIAVAVIVENGGDLGNEATGGRLAAPIARQVIEAHRGVAAW